MKSIIDYIGNIIPYIMTFCVAFGTIESFIHPISGFQGLSIIGKISCVIFLIILGMSVVTVLYNGVIKPIFRKLNGE